jgi:hypothetical protein
LVVQTYEKWSSKDQVNQNGFCDPVKDDDSDIKINSDIIKKKVLKVKQEPPNMNIYN